MKEKKITSLERWNKIEILNGVSEEKKEKLSELFDFALDILCNREKNDINYNVDLGTWTFPVIYRIYNETDIQTSDVVDIIDDLNGKVILNFDNIDEYPVFDRDAMIVAKYSEYKIDDLKNKKGDN